MSVTSTTQDAIEKAILKHVEDSVAHAMQIQTEIAKDALEKALKAEIAKIALSVMQMYSIERNGEDLVIRVRNEFKTGN